MLALSDHIARIAQDETLPQRVEEAARQTAVLPVLDALGWDCWDGNEVTPEFEVRGGRVDYCLQVPGQRLVLIEVKRTGADLTGHQEQLLRYAFDEGVPLAALTDGRVWWLYLSTAAGSWEQRRFYSIDFRQQEAARAAADLERFLSRTGVVGGTALEEARREFESQERDRRVRAALEQAWRQVLGDRDGLLRDLLAEEVSEIVGHRPDPETIADFLAGIVGIGSAGSAPQAGAVGRAAPPPTHPVGRSGSSVTRFAGRRIAAFLLDGGRHQVKSWPHLVQALCDQLAMEAGAAFAERVATVRGRTRVLFSENPDDLQRPRELANSNLYVEGNLSARRAEQIARLTLRAIRGSDDGFRIELVGQEAPANEPASLPETTGLTPPTGSFKGRRPAAFWLDGNRYEATRWNEVLQRVCDQVAKGAGQAFVDLVAPLRGKNRLYFSEDPNQLHQPLRMANSVLFVDGKFSANDCVRLARRVLIAVRGSDDGFRTELAE